MEGNIAYNRAIEAHENGNYQEACNYYEQAVNADPENSMKNNDEIYTNWGVALSILAVQENSKDLYEASIDKFKKATELNSSSFAAYYNWGITLFSLAKRKNNDTLYESIIEKYKKATELDPSYSEVYNDWGLALSDLAFLENNKDLFESSIEKYKKAIELNPNYSEAYYNWGMDLSVLAGLENNKDLYESSIEKYKKATELDPNNFDAYFVWGLTLLDLAKLENNISEYKEDIIEVLLKLEKLEEGSGAYNLAQLYSLLNEKDTAFKYLENALLMEKTFGRDSIEKDKDLDNLKSDPRFEKLLNEYFPKGKN